MRLFSSVMLPSQALFFVIINVGARKQARNKCFVLSMMNVVAWALDSFRDNHAFTNTLRWSQLSIVWSQCSVN